MDTMNKLIMMKRNSETLRINLDRPQHLFKDFSQMIFKNRKMTVPGFLKATQLTMASLVIVTYLPNSISIILELIIAYQKA